MQTETWPDVMMIKDKCLFLIKKKPWLIHSTKLILKYCNIKENCQNVKKKDAFIYLKY